MMLVTTGLTILSSTRAFVVAAWPWQVVTMEPFVAATSSSSAGRWAFVAVFAALILWLLMMPASLLHDERGPRPWWANVRYWAIAVATAQMLVYLLWRA